MNTGAVTISAIIFAAGRGSRLGDLTSALPKPMLSVRGRPIIVRIIEGLVRARIERVALITGYRAEVIEAELGNGAQSGLEIRYFRQLELDGTARALLLAHEFLGDKPFIFSWADILVPPENYRRVISAARFADGALAVNEVEDPCSGAAVYVDGNSWITRIVEKPAKGSSTTRWNNAGFGVLPPAIWPAVDALESSATGEYELPRAIAGLVEAGAQLRAVPVEGEWFDIGTPADLAAAEAAGAARAGS